MPYPPIYDVTYSYTGFQYSQQGISAFPGTRIDADFAGLRDSIVGVSNFMKGVVRSDGALQNGIVTYDSLSANLQVAGLAPADAWVTPHDYLAGNGVVIDSTLYRCLVDHTSGVFATDLAAGKWVLVSALQAGAQGPQGDQGPQGAPGQSGGVGATGASYGGTSTTSLTIGTGSKAFTTQAGLAYVNGARVRASSASGPTNWMEGIVTYSGTTLTMTSDKTNGSGTKTDWNLNIVGEPGAGDLTAANALSELSAVKATARANLGVSIGIPDVIIQEQQSSGTHGGTATSGSWLTRVLNTLVRNNGSIASLASNRVTLGAGTYHFRWNTPGYFCDRVQSRLQNVTDGTTAVIGTSEQSPGTGMTDATQARSTGSAVVTIAGSKDFEIQLRVSKTATTAGLGIAAGFGNNEVYSHLEITKLG